jgi:hypothetical protein
MKGFIILVLVGSLAGCAGQYRRPESFEAKMARFQPQNANPNKVPQYEISPQISDTFTTPSPRGRGPASVSKPKTFKLPSTKRLYFITLYGQYKDMSGYLGNQEAPKLNHCPSFHTTLINYQGRTPDYNAKKEVKWEKRYSQVRADMVGTFPELALPVTYEEENPRLYDVIKSEGVASAKKNFQKALGIHLTKTYKELNELCESGTSENYYNYENLMTHIRREGEEFAPNKHSLKILLKTTVFSNIALIKSLERDVSKGRVPASAIEADIHGHYEDGLIQSLGVEWTKSYIDQLKRVK